MFFDQAPTGCLELFCPYLKTCRHTGFLFHYGDHEGFFASLLLVHGPVPYWAFWPLAGPRAHHLFIGRRNHPRLQNRPHLPNHPRSLFQNCLGPRGSRLIICIDVMVFGRWIDARVIPGGSSSWLRRASSRLGDKLMFLKKLNK